MGSFETDVLSGVSNRMKELGISQSKLSRDCGEPQTSISRWLLGQSSPILSSIGPIIDYLGGRLMWPGDNGTVVSVNVQGGGNVEWRGIPIVSWQTLGARPRRFVAKSDVIGMVVRHGTHRSICGRKNLLAVTLGEHRKEMSPSVLPEDTIIVDVDVHTAQHGRLYVLCEPSGELRVCRLMMERTGADTILIVMEDSRPGHSESFSLLRDYAGRDLDSVIVGEVVGLDR